MVWSSWSHATKPTPSDRQKFQYPGPLTLAESCWVANRGPYGCPVIRAPTRTALEPQKARVGDLRRSDSPRPLPQTGSDLRPLPRT